MMSTQDLADITSYAAANGHKVLIAGDQEQLAAVEGGGGMMLLAGRLGFVQLTEAVRFTSQWERSASLGLRRADMSALEEYHRHGRITGSEPDLALDQARAAYLGSYLTGRDVLMIARAHETCRELSRRVRDDLIHLGLVDDTRTAALRAGARAGAGDLIVARRNDHDLQAGQDDRSLANGDVMRVAALNHDGSLTVQRRTGRDPGTGQASWSQATFRYADTANTDLAYAVTGHSAQGLTVSHGIAVVTGSESRQWLYSAITRGADLNQAIVFTQPARPADPVPGTRTAPELARYRRLRAERAGDPAPATFPSADPDPREPVAVLGDVLTRDEAQEAALDVLWRELGDADHLARLHPIWQGETLPARQEAWRAAIRAAMPAEYRGARLDGGTATWLWRTLRAVEAAGKDAVQVAAAAIRSAPLTGAREVAAVIDARIRKGTGPLTPGPWQPWAQRVPHLADPGRRQFVAELAEAMDTRRARIGEHAAQTAPAWAVNALGPVPENPIDRLEWTEQASAVGAYRELYGIDSETRPVGPEPVNSPEARHAWMAAYSALLRQDPSGLETLPDSALLLRRAQYQAETAWAPPYPGEELRQVRMAQLDMADRQVRHDAEAAAARARGDQTAAAKRADLADSARTASKFYASRAELDEQLEAARQEWAAHTAPMRLQAVQADALLRSRHPQLQLQPLTSAEPVALPDELPTKFCLGKQRKDAVLQAPKQIMKPPQRSLPERDLERQA